MGLAAWLALHAGVSAFTTWLALGYARRRKLVDLPGERRSHAVPTPRGGGVGIACALLAGCVTAAVSGWLPLVPALGFAGGLVLISGIGWVDDHRPLSPWLRLGVQCLAGLLLAWSLHGTEGRWGWAALTALLVPVLVNVWNFMDGIDGLATTQAVIAGVAFAWLAPGIAYMALAVAVAAAAFLPFNFPRARIFLGDVGSGALGYALAVLVAAAGAERGAVAAGVLLLPLCAFAVDASLTLATRIVARERWWEPHTSHLYQWWVRAGASHGKVTAVYAAFSFGASILALRLADAEPLLAWVATLLWYAGAVLGWRVWRQRIALGNGHT